MTPVGGPGSELTMLFRDLGFGPHHCGKCKSMAADMNRWGVGGCRLPENRATIIAQLDDGQAECSLWDCAKAAAIAASKGWTFALTWDGLIEEACRRAEEKV